MLLLARHMNAFFQYNNANCNSKVANSQKRGKKTSFKKWLEKKTIKSIFIFSFMPRCEKTIYFQWIINKLIYFINQEYHSVFSVRICIKFEIIFTHLQYNVYDTYIIIIVLLIFKQILCTIIKCSISHILQLRPLYGLLAIYNSASY